ncbi:MAG: YceI family protein [Planctomycetaceae bacterium]|nr:YceI family protein [Planctomycetaceae bacterium]
MRLLAASIISGLFLAPLAMVQAADTYALDPGHFGVNFKVSHLGLSWTYGRFNQAEGTFILDAANPARSSFSFVVKVDSLDTNSKQRDDHLRSPDFFNAKQFPKISFTSTAVRPLNGGYEVTGDLTLHGVTRPVTLQLLGGKTAEFPQGTTRTGFTTDLVLKRTAFGMDKMTDAIGDDVHVSISFEGTKQ